MMVKIYTALNKEEGGWYYGNFRAFLQACRYTIYVIANKRGEKEK